MNMKPTSTKWCHGGFQDLALATFHLGCAAVDKERANQRRACGPSASNADASGARQTGAQPVREGCLPGRPKVIVSRRAAVAVGATLGARSPAESGSRRKTNPRRPPARGVSPRACRGEKKWPPPPFRALFREQAAAASAQLGAHAISVVARRA